MPPRGRIALSVTCLRVHALERRRVRPGSVPAGSRRLDEALVSPEGRLVIAQKLRLPDCRCRFHALSLPSTGHHAEALSEAVSSGERRLNRRLGALRLSGRRRRLVGYWHRSPTVRSPGRHEPATTQVARPTLQPAPMAPSSRGRERADRNSCGTAERHEPVARRVAPRTGQSHRLRQRPRK